MTIEVNLTQIIFILIALVSAVWAVMRLGYAQFEKSQDGRFRALSDILEKDKITVLNLERDLLRFQSDIPRTYMRRDDAVHETAELKQMILREMAPLRQSVNRIEDFLIQK